MKVDQGEIYALIKLLDDPDDQIFKHIKSKLISFGDVVIPFLQSSWEYSDYNMILHQRIENLIQEIQFSETKNELQNWIESGANNLLDASIIISKIQYPNLNIQKVHQYINQLERDIWLELNNSLTALEKVGVFNKIIFDIHQFKGNTDDYFNPNNSFINKVIESKQGNPLSLSVIYIELAKRLNVPVYGVNLPNHFVLCYIDENNISEYLQPSKHRFHSENSSKVLFFINAFNKGSIFNHEEIDKFIEELKIPVETSFYEPCDNLKIIRRMLQNLLYCYSKADNEEKEDLIVELLELFA